MEHKAGEIMSKTMLADGKAKKGKNAKKGDGLSKADRAILERLKNSRDEFGERVNAIEAQVS